jgi:hypothetical protein
MSEDNEAKAILTASAKPATKLHPGQRQVVRRYAESVFAGDRFHIFNEHFDKFRTTVLSLPNCRDFAEADVISIAAEGLMEFYPQQREEKKRTGKYLDLGSELSDHYIAFLESIPRSYLVRITLPGVKGLGTSVLRLSDQISLHCSTAAPAADRRLNRLSDLFLPLEKSAADATVLEINVSGFAEASLETQGASDALALAKQAAFLFISMGLMRQSGWGTNVATSSLVDLATGREEALTLPAGLAARFARLAVADDNLEVVDPGKGLLSGIRRAQTDEERRNAFAAKLEPIIRFLARTSAPGQRRIAAGMEWYQDSVSAQDQTIAFVAACIGIEAVLGEEEGGLTELSRRLVDRYAFMLGKDREDRSRLAQEFESVLKVRGELVHARSTRLRARDRDRLKTVQQMLSRLLEHELRPLTAE